MRKQTVILTAWLTMPFLCITFIMTWIFVTLDKDRLMDEPPIGAGAGDTGNANALGQWLAGRDADLVSDALDARREQRQIDPRDWPGGVEIQFPASLFAPGTERCILTLIHDEQGRYTSSSIPLTNAIYTKAFTHDKLKGSRFVLWTSIPESTPSGLTDDKGRLLKVFTINPTIPPIDIQISDPLPLIFEMDSIYQ